MPLEKITCKDKKRKRDSGMWLDMHGDDEPDSMTAAFFRCIYQWMDQHGRVDRLDRIQPHLTLQRRHPSSRSTSSDHRKIGLLRGPALPIPKSSWERGQHTPALIRPAGALLWDAVEVPVCHLCLDADEIIPAPRQPLRLFPRGQLPDAHPAAKVCIGIYPLVRDECRPPRSRQMANRHPASRSTT
ncbi:hypothetical protein BO94DRAFT_313757 [Aspergillus sclerotioniger CBS 115572]|uniref:Uncharacterized protein n=1 Tax=Aspergillus sclerotioniger CBS 115572 TaxID=1450535 RepID=A0A317X5T1_9EURO|nr:hypothetical protein BO94DRAFT_313757 [Aspergillus sclerotioniger CBS 115572]PWY93929.1 hypothetical protein BO94DRAFT_313757 [Aspergillus sclerotioniger CBS 115572]